MRYNARRNNRQEGKRHFGSREFERCETDFVPYAISEAMAFLCHFSSLSLCLPPLAFHKGEIDLCLLSHIVRLVWLFVYDRKLTSESKSNLIARQTTSGNAGNSWISTFSIFCIHRKLARGWMSCDWIPEISSGDLNLTRRFLRRSAPFLVNTAKSNEYKT